MLVVVADAELVAVLMDPAVLAMAALRSERRVLVAETRFEALVAAAVASEVCMLATARLTLEVIESVTYCCVASIWPGAGGDGDGPHWSLLKLTVLPADTRNS